MRDVLIACEFSGIVRDAFRAKGYDAWSCDLLPCERDSKYHLQGDVRLFLQEGWKLLIAHPPCTYLCNSGVRWLNDSTNSARWAAMEDAAQFFKEMLDAPIPRIAVENPIMHGYALRLIGTRYSQIIQPWQFGHRETKATCLWLKGLRPLVPTDVVGPPPRNAARGTWNRVHRCSPGPERWRERSRTLLGIAEAMTQWMDAETL
jgi:hypothetical protein